MRPTHLLTSALVTFAVIGCGGGDAPEPKPKPKQYSAQHVVTFFKHVTGDPLETSTNPSFDSISVDHGDSDRADVMDTRYGSFLIYVLRRPGSESIYKTEQGRPIKPDPEGVYWHNTGGSWEAMKPYGNVVLSWNSDERMLGDGFHRLDALLSQLGKPAEQVRAAMPESDHPCGEQSAAGTCRGDNGATVTTVERDQRLTLENLEVKVVRVETGRLVDPAARLRARAAGQGPVRARRDADQEHRQ